MEQYTSPEMEIVIFDEEIKTGELPPVPFSSPLN